VTLKFKAGNKVVHAGLMGTIRTVTPSLPYPYVVEFPNDRDTFGHLLAEHEREAGSVTIVDTRAD
jgi:hypothetical protein